MSLLDSVDALINTAYSIIPFKKPALEQLQQVRLVAHRGAYDNTTCFENTLDAFAKAEQCGCWGIEFDIHATKDKQIIVNHDADLNRLWCRSVVINQTEFKTINTLSPDIPLLESVVKLYGGRLHLFIELKSPFTAIDELKKQLSMLIPGQDYHLISLDEQLLLSLTDFPCSARLLVASATNTAYFCELSLKYQLGGVLGHYLLLTNKKINQLMQATQQVGVGFVDSRRSLYREVSRNINWIFTNQAVKLANRLNSDFNHQ